MKRIDWTTLAITLGISWGILGHIWLLCLACGINPSRVASMMLAAYASSVVTAFVLNIKR